MVTRATAGQTDARNENILAVADLVVEFPARGGHKVHAVSGVSFEIARGETLALVGESGCGKSAVARAVMRLPPPTTGSVVVAGDDLADLSSGDLRRARQKMQMIFQDPISSLNPRRRVSDIVADPLIVWGREDERAEAVASALEAVGLDVEQVGDRKAHQFSGGQCQRIAIARALVLEPDLLVCDEPVSSLDVSVQAQILNLFEELKARYGLAMLFISHDLSVVRNVSDRIAVMYLGRLCEVAESIELFEQPLHPYTAVLLASAPAMDGTTASGTLDGELPSAINPPSGCRFRTRCPAATDVCSVEVPEMRELSPGHFVACHNPFVRPS